MLIRPETREDADAIHDLTEAAFAPMRFYDGSEAPAIGKMRERGELVLSLVGVIEGAVIAHVAFSSVTIDGAECGWLGLGPIAVRADLQRQGRGSALVAHALDMLRKQGVQGIVLLGNPAVYHPMGFMNDGNLHHPGTDDRYVHWQVLNGTPLRGTVAFSTALEG